MALILGKLENRGLLVSAHVGWRNSFCECELTVPINPTLQHPNCGNAARGLFGEDFSSLREPPQPSERVLRGSLGRKGIYSCEED